MASLLIVGGGDDFSQNIAEAWDGAVKLVSRKTGHDIQSEDHRKSIASLSKEFDCVLLHACTLDFSQTKLVYGVFDSWEPAEKKGTIFVTGSSRTYNPKQSTMPYLVVKKSLDIAVQQCNKAIETRNLGFQMVNLRLGMLDSQKSRQKDHWQDNGISGGQIAKVMLQLHSLNGVIKVAQMDLYSPLKSKPQ